jgi:hypothetical protein
MGALAFVVALVTACYFAGVRPLLAHAHRQELLQRFQERPDRATAEELAALLDRRRFGKEDGNRVLELLFTPQLAVRSSYPVGKRAYVSTKNPYPLHFTRVWFCIARHKFVRDEEQGSSFSGLGNGITTQPEHIALELPRVQGIYGASVELRVAVFPTEARPGDGPWEELKATAAYDCVVRMPFNLRMVAPEDAERPARVSNPDLDARMRGAFTWTSRPLGGYGYSTDQGEVKARPLWVLGFAPLPESVAFRVTFRGADGSQRPLRGSFCRSRAGERGLYHADLGVLSLLPGDYRGTFLFEPDDEIARQDAAIRTIWGGSLEFPASIRVVRDPQREQTRKSLQAEPSRSTEAPRLR